jgi:hypothetical protein
MEGEAKHMMLHTQITIVTCLIFSLIVPNASLAAEGATRTLTLQYVKEKALEDNGNLLMLEYQYEMNKQKERTAMKKGYIE